MSTCTFAGCTRKPTYPDQSRCEDHRLRWITRQPAEAQQPEWLRRMHRVGLPPKDMTAA